MAAVPSNKCLSGKRGINYPFFLDKYAQLGVVVRAEAGHLPCRRCIPEQGPRKATGGDALPTRAPESTSSARNLSGFKTLSWKLSKIPLI